MDASDPTTAGLFRDPIHRPFSLGDGPGHALLLHGFPGSPAELRPVAEVRAARGWRCHAPLLPGLGPEIDRLGRVRRQDWLAAARSAWRSVRATPGPHLLAGFSMGAALALRLAELDAKLDVDVDARAGTAVEAELRPDARAPVVLLLAPFTGFGDPRMAALPLVRLFVPRYRPFADADLDDPRVRAQLLRIDPSLDFDDPTERARVRREASVPTRAIDEVRRLAERASSERCGSEGSQCDAKRRKRHPRRRRRLAERAWREAEAVRWPVRIVQGRFDTTAPAERTRRLVDRLGGPVLYREVDAGHDMLLRDRDGHDAMIDAVDALVRDAVPAPLRA